MIIESTTYVRREYVFIDEFFLRYGTVLNVQIVRIQWDTSRTEIIMHFLVVVLPLSVPY